MRHSIFPIIAATAFSGWFRAFESSGVLRADGIMPRKPEPKPKFDNERIAEAEARRERKAAKRAEQIAKSRANNYK